MPFSLLEYFSHLFFSLIARKSLRVNTAKTVRKRSRLMVASLVCMSDSVHLKDLFNTNMLLILINFLIYITVDFVVGLHECDV